jgi:hypothetical protein
MTARVGHAGWLIAALLYASAAAGDAALHLKEAPTTSALAPSHVIITFAACLFWPIDLVARVLLPEA